MKFSCISYYLLFVWRISATKTAINSIFSINDTLRSSEATTQYNDPDQVPTLSPYPISDHFNPECQDFTYGHWSSFTTPNYPHKYPNNTNCIRVIQAPSGFGIKVDFRETFKLEPSQGCKYDYVEFRDGPFGYSRLLGRFCGKKFPPMIKSTGEYMWLHFVSDDLAQYSGFKATYTYFYNKDIIHNSHIIRTCKMDIYGKNLKIADTISNNNISARIQQMKKSGQVFDCTWHIVTKPRSLIQIVIGDFKTGRLSECDDTYIEIYDRSTRQEDKQYQICPGVKKEYTSSGNQVFLRVHSEELDVDPKFNMTYTELVKGPCKEGYFDCGDTTCIKAILTCNGISNCRKGMDEKGCTAAGSREQASTTSDHVIVMAVIGSLLCVFITISVLLTWRQHRQRKTVKHLTLKVRLQDDTLETSKLVSAEIEVNKIKLNGHVKKQLTPPTSTLRHEDRYHSDDNTYHRGQSDKLCHICHSEFASNTHIENCVGKKTSTIGGDSWKWFLTASTGSRDSKCSSNTGKPDYASDDLHIELPMLSNDFDNDNPISDCSSLDKPDQILLSTDGTSNTTMTTATIESRPNSDDNDIDKEYRHNLNSLNLGEDNVYGDDGIVPDDVELSQHSCSEVGDDLIDELEIVKMPFMDNVESTPSNAVHVQVDVEPWPN